MKLFAMTLTLQKETSMTLDEKIDIYHRLLAGLAKGVKLAALFDEAGLAQQSKRIQIENQKLAKVAADLRHNISGAWKGQAATVVAGLKEASDQLQKQIKSLENTIANAEKAVKVLGYVDDLIEIAKKVAAGV
jgi:hypothetical protein